MTNQAPMGDESGEALTDAEVEEFLDEATSDEAGLEQHDDGEGQN